MNIKQLIEANSPPPAGLEAIKTRLANIRANGDAGADISFARLAAAHGNFTVEAKEYARRYAAGEI